MHAPTPPTIDHAAHSAARLCRRLFPMAETPRTTICTGSIRANAVFSARRLNISRSLAKTVRRRKKFEIRVDHDFDAVLAQCALSRPGGQPGSTAQSRSCSANCSTCHVPYVGLAKRDCGASMPSPRGAFSGREHVPQAPTPRRSPGASCRALNCGGYRSADGNSSRAISKPRRRGFRHDLPRMLARALIDDFRALDAQTARHKPFCAGQQPAVSLGCRFTEFGSAARSFGWDGLGLSRPLAPPAEAAPSGSERVKAAAEAGALRSVFWASARGRRARGGGAGGGPTSTGARVRRRIAQACAQPVLIGTNLNRAAG